MTTVTAGGIRVPNIPKDRTKKGPMVMDFISLLKAGKYTEGLAVYREAIKIADHPEFLTGEMFIDKKIVTRLASLNKKLEVAKTATSKSNLLILQGNARYDA